MKRTKVVLGSLAVHAVVAALLLSVERAPVAPASRPTVAVEVVAPAATPPRETASLLPGSAGGAAGPPAPAPRPQLVASRARRSAPRTASDVDPRGAITFEAAAGGGELGGGGGDGTGQGAGRGAGIGFGDGGTIERLAERLEAPPAPPPPKVSKARPARLIFPSRQREVDDAELYVMKVTVDTDGFVSGAKLVRGFGGHRDEVASDQIWRFRYEPALDDDGRPVASVVEQRFLVQ